MRANYSSFSRKTNVCLVWQSPLRSTTSSDNSSLSTPSSVLKVVLLPTPPAMKPLFQALLPTPPAKKPLFQALLPMPPPKPLFQARLLLDHSGWWAASKLSSWYSIRRFPKSSSCQSREDQHDGNMAWYFASLSKLRWARDASSSRRNNLIYDPSSDECASNNMGGKKTFFISEPPAGIVP